MYVCHFCTFVRNVGHSFLHPSDVVNDVPITEITHFKSHSQLVCDVLQETNFFGLLVCSVCCTGVTLVTCIQNVVCKLYGMQMINWRTFCTFSNSFANISRSSNLIVF